MLDVLKKARKKKKMTQSQIANQLKMSTSNYCNIENGIRGISLSQGIELSKILDLSLEEIKNFIQKVHKMKTKSE